MVCVCLYIIDYKKRHDGICFSVQKQVTKMDVYGSKQEEL